jgi:hypothetical protein
MSRGELRDLFEELKEEMKEEFNQKMFALRMQLNCTHCKTPPPPPPPPRWPGDPYSRDERPPHTCGLSGGEG